VNRALTSLHRKGHLNITVTVSFRKNLNRRVDLKNRKKLGDTNIKQNSFPLSLIFISGFEIHILYFTWNEKTRAENFRMRYP